MTNPGQIRRPDDPSFIPVDRKLKENPSLCGGCGALVYDEETHILFHRAVRALIVLSKGKTT